MRGHRTFRGRSSGAVQGIVKREWHSVILTIGVVALMPVFAISVLAVPSTGLADAMRNVLGAEVSVSAPAASLRPTPVRDGAEPAARRAPDARSARPQVVPVVLRPSPRRLERSPAPVPAAPAPFMPVRVAALDDAPVALRRPAKIVAHTVPARSSASPTPLPLAASAAPVGAPPVLEIPSVRSAPPLAPEDFPAGSPTAGKAVVTPGSADPPAGAEPPTQAAPPAPVPSDGTVAPTSPDGGGSVGVSGAGAGSTVILEPNSPGLETSPASPTEPSPVALEPTPSPAPEPSTPPTTEPGSDSGSPPDEITGPGRSADAAGQANAPGRSDIVPGHAGGPSPDVTGPGSSADAPGRMGDAPGRSGAAPGLAKGRAPGRSATAPGRVR